MPRSCAATNQRSACGERKKAGECLMTRIAFGDVDAKTTPAPAFTKCLGCRLEVCVDCWECMACQLELISGQREIVMHDVWHCLLARGFTGKSRCRGFDSRTGGGGHWTRECPFCVDVKFTKPSPCVPASISGRAYERHPPKLLHGTRTLVRSAVVLDDGSFGRVRAHTVEFIVYAQLIDNSECKRCFKCVPTVSCAPDARARALLMH